METFAAERMPASLVEVGAGAARASGPAVEAGLARRRLRTL